MKRFCIILLSLAMLGSLAFGVFEVEHEADALRAELEEINRQLLLDQEEVHVLKAEWSYLTRPERIRKLAEKYLKMRAVEVSQVQDIDAVAFKPVDVARGKLKHSGLRGAASSHE